MSLIRTNDALNLKLVGTYNRGLQTTNTYIGK